MRVVLLALFLALLNSPCLAGQEYGRVDKWAKLKGLRQVEIELMGSLERLRELGFVWDDLETQMQLRLRQSSIKITDFDLSRLSASNKDRIPPYTILRLRIDVATGSLDEVAFVVDLIAYTRMKLPNNPNRTGELLFWSDGNVGKTVRSELQGVLGRSAGSLIDRFCNDWLTANPKK